jgi:sugar phosphate isomerase/epimerase
MPFRVGVTTGLYYIAHDVSLASTVKKIGYTLTRGADVVEISGDTPHEISRSEGKEIRNLAGNQGLTTLFHGSLTVPMCMPERLEWRDAQDHMEKSVRSAVNGGCNYVLFHACLHFWVELLTYTGTKLTITMCDHAGRFVSEILYENPRLRRWFRDNMRSLGDINYAGLILTEEEISHAQYKAHGEMRAWQQNEVERRKRQLEVKMGIDQIVRKAEAGKPITAEEQVKLRQFQTEVEKINQQVGGESGEKESTLQRDYLDRAAEEKMAMPKQEQRRWRIDTHGRLVDIYKIVAHHLFFTKDPQWMSMAEVYKDLLAQYKIDYTDDKWLNRAWNEAEIRNDYEFKRFFYAVVGAKFLEGHMRELFKWMEGDLISKELKDFPDLQELARKLKVTIEIPDARDPKYAGRYILSHPKQIYSAVRTVRKVLKTDRIWMTIDNEHLATQGYDPWEEGKWMAKNYPDYGKMVQSVHCTYPTPLHSHYPIELGQTEVYELLWYLRTAGAGKDPGNTVYLIFERGGGDDPFRQSVDALKLMARFLERDTPPDQLPDEFYGVKDTAFDEKRQHQIMMDHRFDILKDLFNVPEEEWGLFSTEAVKKGKKDIFKKEELQ